MVDRGVALGVPLLRPGDEAEGGLWAPKLEIVLAMADWSMMRKVALAKASVSDPGAGGRAV